MNFAELTKDLTRDPKRIFFSVMALSPFVVATLYMTFKEPPVRLKRTHGGSVTTPDTAPAADNVTPDPKATPDATP